MASEVADIPQAVNEKVEGEDRKLVNDTTNIVLDNLSKEETMDADVIPNEPQEILNSTFEEENVKNNKEACAVEGEGENFLNLSSTAKVSDEENNSSPDAYEVIEKPDQANKDACKIQSLKDEKLGNRQEEIIATRETSLEEIPQYAEELSINLDKVVDRSVVPVEDTADATSGLKVEDSIHAPDSEDVRIGTSIGETGAEKFVSGRNGKMEENFDVTLEKGSQETITFREDTMDATKNECEFQDPNNSESSFLKDAEDGVIFESNKTMTAPEVSKVGNHSIQTSEKVEANSLKQVDESQIKHEECTQNESRKLSSTAAPTQDIDHEEIEAGDLGKAEISEDERSSENYLPNEKPVESLHVAPEEIKTYASCPSLEQRLCTNPRGILSDETKDKTIDAADKKDVATIDANEEPGGSIPYSSTNDSKVTHQLKKGKENDGPSIDAHHNPVNNRNICSKGGDQINSLDDLDDSKASYEVTEDRSKETKIQVDDDQKMNSKSDIETQMMDEEHDTTIPSEATTDEPIKICQETIELDVTHSSENIEWNKDLKITHPLEDGKDNDGPSMDAPVNNSSNICSKGGGVDQIKSLEDPDDSEASHEVKEDQIKEKETQVNDDQKMPSKPNDTETQMMKREHDTTTLPEATTDETIKIDQEMNEDQKMTSKHDEIETKLMDREQDTTILSEATINEPINICQETIELGITHSSENIEWKKDLNITHPLEEGNDGPSIDASVNKSSNMYNKKEGGDQIDSLEDSDDSKGSCEVTKGQSKEIETQVNDDQNMTMEREHNTTTQSKATADETIKIGQEMNDEQKMTNKPDAIETQMMDREHDTTIQSKATADEPITICPKTTELEDTFSSERMEKIIQFDDNRNQHAYVASILEEEVAESFEGEKNRNDIPSQEDLLLGKTIGNAKECEGLYFFEEANREPFLIQVEDSYPVDDDLGNSTQFIDADSEAKDNFTVSTAEKTEIEVSFKQENEMNEPATKDVATTDLNVAIGGSIPCNSANDLNAIHPPEEGKDNDGPSIDVPVNDSNNKCSEGRGDWTKGLKDQDYSEASCEATEDQGKEIESQVTDDHKMISELDDIEIPRMDREQNITIRSEATNDKTIKICQDMSDDQKTTSRSDDIEIQMMAKEHDTTILLEAIADEPIKICQETTELEVTHSSENIEWKKDLNITQLLEEGKDNDGPSLDAPVNNSNNICSEGEVVDQINSLEDLGDSEASRKVTVDQIKETDTQVNDDQKMLSKPDDTETRMMEREHDTTTLSQAIADETIEIGQEMNDDQKMISEPNDIEAKMMDRGHDTTVQLETTADESIKVCQETTKLEVTHSSENNEWKKDLNITHQLEERKDDVPSLDAPVNNSSNICNKAGGGNQINRIEDPADFEGSCEVTEGQSTETEIQLNDDQNMTSELDDTETQIMEREHITTTQSKAIADEIIEIGQNMNDDQKMTSTPYDIETQMMGRKHDTTIQSEPTANEPIKIFQETTELENTLSSENIKKIIQLDENRNQHVYVASILEKVAESFEGKKNITDIHSQEVEDSYPVDDGMDNSTQIINADSGAKDNFTILIAKETETEVSFEQENEMNEPDTKDVATADLNEATGGSIPYYRANDLNPLEEGKDNDGPLIDNPVNNSNNKCSEGRGDWINGLEDQDDSEASREVIEYQGKETESQVTDDEKMTSEPDYIETQRMDREQNSTIRSEARNDETIKICQEVDDDQKMNSKPDDIETQIMDMERDTIIQSEATADEAKICHEMTQIEVTYSSENIEKIILLDENRNQHVPVASILEGKNAESFEGDKTITDIPSQQVEVSYQGHDECIGNSAQIIKDSGANENSRVLSAEETETRVLCEEEKKIKEPDTEILERRLRSQDTDLQIMMETDGFTAKLEENSAKESSQDDEGSKESKNAKAELSTREVVNVVAPSSVIEENKLDENQKIDERNETQAALSNCNDQVAAAGNASQNTFNLNLEESYNHSYEEQNLLPVSCNETKDDSSENIEGSSIIPDSSSALKTTENIDIEKAIVGQDGNARNADDFLKENLDTQKATLESKTEHENRMEDLDINSLNSMTEKAMQNLESVEPSKEPPSTSEPVIELKNKRSPESTITTVVNDGIKAMEERNKLIGEVLISQHSLDGTVDTNDDGSEHGADGKQHIDLIQEVVKVYQNDKTTEQEEKVIEQDFESRQREASCEKKIQLGADDTIDRTPDCDQIITGGSLSEEILQVQQENENTDSEGKIKERIEEEGCPEDVQMIAVADAAMHEEKGVDCSIKNLLSDDSKEKITPDIAEGLNQKQEKSSVTEVPEDEKLVNITSLASIAREENCEYEVFHEPTSLHDKTDTEDVQVLDDSIIFSSKANPVQVDPEEGTELLVPCGQREEPMQQDLITALKEIEEQPRNACEAGYKGKMTLDIDKDLNMRQEEFSVTKESEDEKLANITSLASVATEENSDYKVVHDPSSFHDKTDTEVVKVLDDSITFSLKDIPGPVDPEESTELQVLCGEKLESIQHVPITVLEEIEEDQPRNTSEAVSKENMTLDIDEDLNREQEELYVTKESEDEKLANITNLAFVTEKSSNQIIVPESSSFHDKTDAEDVQGLDEAIIISSKENIVQVDPGESAELKVPCGEKVESTQQDPITVLEEIEEGEELNTSEAVSKGKMTLDIDEDLNRKQEELSVMSEDEKLAYITSLASVATEENGDHKIVPEPSSFHEKTDAEDVQVLDDVSSKENMVQVHPEESTELQVPRGEKVESMQPDPITVLEEIEEEQPRNTSEAVPEENKTLDIHENLDQELEELSDTKVSEDEKLVNITNLASEATEENGDYKIVPETSSFDNKTDVEDVQVLDDAVTISSKENIVQLDPKESTELQVPHGEKVESMQQDPITVLEEIEEQQRSTSEAVSKEKNTLDIIEDLNQEQEESPVTEVPEDKKLANTTRLASVATEENSDCKIVIEPTSFQDRTDTEDVKVLDDCVAFSTGSLVQVDPIENTELQVLCGEKVEAIRQDPITALEEIEEQQPRNASEAVSEARGVIYEGTKKTTDNCEEITDSSSFVELDGISPYNYLQESRKATPQMGEDKGTEKPQDNLHTLVHTKDCPMEMVRKDAQLYVARADGSEDTGVMEKLVAASLLALDKNMVEEEEEFKESEFAENSTTNKNIQQLKQEDTSVTVMTDGKNMKPAVEPQEAKCGQEKITVGETMESRKESTSIEIAKSSPGEFLQIYSMETSHEEDRSTKEKELYAEKIEPTEDKRAKLQEEKDEEEEACNQKKSAVNVAILEEKGLDSSSIKNLVETNLDECKHKITQEELSLKTMSEEEKPVNMISLASKATEENSESNSFHQKTASKDLQVVEDSITCSNKENIVQIYPKESTDQDPSGEKVELMKQDSVTALEEREEQQTGKSSETISEAKGVNREGEKGITDNCKERVASSSFVPIDEISHSNPLLESRTEVLQDGEEKETESQQNSIHILVHAIDSTLEITPKDAPSCIASADGSDDHPVMQELEVVSPLALDKNVVDEANYEETSHVEDHSTNKEELHEERTEPTEDKEAKAEEDEAGKSKRSDFGSQALILVEERDKDAIGSVSEAPFEDLKVEGEANKFTDKADTAPSTVTKKEMNVEEICENEKSTNSHDETPEITNATSDDLGGQEVESARVAETAASVPQSETVEAHNADIGIAVVEQSESGEIEIADEENESEAVYKSNDQNIEELISLEFPNLTKNDAENNEKETDKDYEKGFETKCERAEAVIEDNITSDQGKEELPEKPLELLSKVQLFDNKLQSTENNDHGENEEGMEHGEEASKDEDNSINSTKKEEVDNVVDSNIEILQPDKLEKALESETQVRSIEVIPKGGQTKTEEENLEAAKEEMGNVEIVAEEICEAKESKINISSEQTKDEAKAVEDFPLGFPNEEIIPERYQEGEEKPEEYLKVKTEEAVKSATEKVSGNFEQAFVKENVSEHIVFDNKAVEEPKQSIVGIFQVKEEGKIAEGIATIVNNQEKGHELDDVYVETEREVLSEEVKISGVAFLKHGEDRTGANEDTGLQNKNFNFSPKGDAAAGELLDNENIISEAAPTKLIRETIEDNKEIIMKEKESIERKDEKPSITESLGDGEIEERQNKNQHESETDEQLNDEVCISNRVQENDEEQVVLLAGEGEVIADEADSCSRQIKDGNEKPDFSSHSTDPSEISHSNGALGIAKDNENSTDLRMLEKIFTGTTESEISELTCPNESEETITSPGSKDIQSMEQVSETIAVDAEMHDSNAGTASSDVQEATGVKSREEEKEEDDYKKMKETSTSTECAIPTSKIKQGYAVETLVVVEDQETEDKLVELHHFPHLHHIQDSEGKTEEDGPVDLQRARNITEDMQELDERSIALSNKENLAETDPNESKEHEVSSRGKGLALIQQDPVPATFQEEIDDQQPGNSSEAVSEVKDAICEEEKVTITNCNEFTENNSCVTSDKVSPSNMLQGSASEAAQGTKDKNTPTQCHELPLSSDIKSSDMERTQMDVESWVETVDDINVTNAMQNLDAASVPASDKLTVIDAYHTKNVEFFNSTVDNKYMTQLQQDTAEIFQAEGKIPTPSELEQEERTADETIESTKKSVSTEIAKASLPYILQGSLKESSEMADHRTEGREPTVQKEELKAEKTEEAEDKEEKCDEEKDSHEESREQKGSDLSFESPVPVDAGDVHTKVSHKKSHNILSGVGSKVKHSIAKVKKAITGKSSHPKPPSPKESKKC